jgi:rare lipoprotein A (peptidoglycan hydrolase)
VTNLNNKRSVIVTINRRLDDPNILLDLAEPAAKSIGMNSTGTTPIRIEILTRAEDIVDEEAAALDDDAPVVSVAPQPQVPVEPGLEVAATPQPVLMPNSALRAAVPEPAAPTPEKVAPTSKKVVPSSEKVAPSPEKVVPPSEKVTPPSQTKSGPVILNNNITVTYPSASPDGEPLQTAVSVKTETVPPVETNTVTIPSSTETASPQTTKAVIPQDEIVPSIPETPPPSPSPAPLTLAQAKILPSLPDPRSPYTYRIQIGTFSTEESAYTAYKEASELGYRVYYERNKDAIRVVIPWTAAADVEHVVKSLAAHGFASFWIRRERAN